jgi:hypothetical protein
MLTKKQKRQQMFDEVPTVQEFSTIPGIYASTPIASNPSLTTSHKLVASPETLQLRVRSAELAEPLVTVDPTFISRRASESPGLPVKVGRLSISAEFQPSVGVYILTGPSAVGKTVTTLALCAWANGAGVPASYISCFEPRSPASKERASMFRDPLLFWANAKKLVILSDERKLIVYDSATLPMKANAKNWVGQGTFAGGMQPSDRDFLDQGSTFAINNNACVILPLNATLVPYVKDLAGAVEGIILINSVGSFSIADRGPTSGREFRDIQIPNAFVQAALTELELGTLRLGSVRSRIRGYSGVNVE